MSLKIESKEYRWIENWITIPESPLGKTNGRTHSVTVLKNGDVVIFHQADPAVLFYSPDGVLLKKWGNFPGAHGLTLVEEDGRELLWLVDERTKSVVKTTLDGEVLMSLPQPPHPEYASGNYIPTWAAVAEERFGGNGDIWVADGYGSHLVHRFNRSGAYLGTLDGSEGAGRFNCPHGLALDNRRSEAEFYIADRGNSRFQVYGMDGTSNGADQLLLVDSKGEHRIPCAGKVGFPFFGELILDCLHGTEKAMTQAHAFRAAELCLKSQNSAQCLTKNK